jgi:YgiT-type zinc finger domain-containing protein
VAARPVTALASNGRGLVYWLVADRTITARGGQAVREAGYGRCPCSGTYEQRWVEVRMTVSGRVVVITDVPQGACPVCGSRVYKTDVLEMIEAFMRDETGQHSAAP